MIILFIFVSYMPYKCATFNQVNPQIQIKGWALSTICTNFQTTFSSSVILY